MGCTISAFERQVYAIENVHVRHSSRVPKSGFAIYTRVNGKCVYWDIEKYVSASPRLTSLITGSTQVIDISDVSVSIHDITRGLIAMERYINLHTCIVSFNTLDTSTMTYAQLKNSVKYMAYAAINFRTLRIENPVFRWLKPHYVDSHIIKRHSLMWYCMGLYKTDEDEYSPTHMYTYRNADVYALKFENMFDTACANSDIHILDWIHTVNPGITHRSRRYFPKACYSGNLDVAKWLYSKLSLNVHYSNDLLFRVVCKKGHLDVAKWLYYTVGGVDYAAEENNALYLATKHHKFEVVTWLESLYPHSPFRTRPEGSRIIPPSTEFTVRQPRFAVPATPSPKSRFHMVSTSESSTPVPLSIVTTPTVISVSTRTLNTRKIHVASAE